MDYLGYTPVSEDDDVVQYGTKRHSGRYPWGSGEDPYQHSGDWLSRVKELEAQGLSQVEIAAMMGVESTTDFRTYRRRANNIEKQDIAARIKSLKADGLSNGDIAERLGWNRTQESTVREYLEGRATANTNRADNTAELLMNRVQETGKFIDISEGTERALGVSKETLKEAILICQAEGYLTYGRNVQTGAAGKAQMSTVLCPPGTEYKEVYQPDSTRPFLDYASKDGGETFYKMEYPSSMDSSRLMIRYAEDGGISRDGTMEIRRGVQDLSLGDDHYAQVRILVDDTHYLKGMAVYSDDMPDGVDIIFNTNKTRAQAPEKLDALKEIHHDDPVNPFGSAIKANGQSYYDDPNGKFTNPETGNPASLSLINKRASEGDWSDWTNAIPSQFLSKQSTDLAQRQIDLAIKQKEEQYEEIMSLNNPTIRKKLLYDFANTCDSNSVNLKAAALPRQKYHVILPDDNLKDDETYAPNYENGTKLALIRYPHGGIFEIPIVTVNNNASAWSKQMIGSSPDALSINSKVAERLSGADFDGDTVMAIPITSSIKISSKPQLEDLVGFDSKSYRYSKEEIASGAAKLMKDGQQKQTQMGIASNLITDMTLKGADDGEMARAVKYSMVVIDAPKHKLDYSRAYDELGIAALKERYQGHVDEVNGRYREGASTLISKAKSEQRVEKRKGTPRINTPLTEGGRENEMYDPNRPEGVLIYKSEKETYINDKGKEVERQTKSTKMAETDDAFTLVSEKNTAMERVYAAYANKLKSMANTARKEYIATKEIEYNKDAASVYKEEVSSLKSKLNLAKENAPKERQARIYADDAVKIAKQNNPDMTKDEVKKVRDNTLKIARANLGARKEKIQVNGKEWEAIQSGAISKTLLKDILANCDMDTVKKYALPKTESNTLNSSKIALIKSYKNSGYTQAEIAAQLGVSVSTVNKYLK